MLIQHVVIYLVMHHVPINQVSRYGIVFLFYFIIILIILITLVILTIISKILANRIQKDDVIEG